MKIQLQCASCKKDFLKEKKEVNRILKSGRVRFFCSLKCTPQRRSKIETISRLCVCCGKFFTTKESGKHSYNFCSRSCGSSSSVTEERRATASLSGKRSKGNLSPYDQTLKKREMWKYKGLHAYLKSRGIKHEFEYQIGSYVVDLILLEDKKIIEFDGPYHKSPSQKYKDLKRDLYLKEHGFSVSRIIVVPSSEIPVGLISV